MMILAVISDLIWVALIASIPTTLAVILSHWRTESAVNETKNKLGYAVQEIHLLINSRMDELLKASAAKSRAEGINEERNREDPQPKPKTPNP